MIKIGIDPGVTGAIAVLDKDNRLLKLLDMPTMQNGKRRQVNPYELSKMMSHIEDTNMIDMVYLETVASRPGQGVASTFSFGVSFGIIQGVLAGVGLPVTMVTPRTWKKRAKLIGYDKDLARTIAQRLYPQAALGRKMDIGRADALLIARFGGE
jgi:crossover junction endodeoxyribonuclease RuvC